MTTKIKIMQAVKDGVWQRAEPFDGKALSEMLIDENVDHVEVFPATDKNLKVAKKRTGKKFKWKCGHGYKKAPKNLNR